MITKPRRRRRRARTAPLRTPKQAGEWAAVSERTVLREIAAGRLVARRIGAQWRIDPADLERWGLAHSGQLIGIANGVKSEASTSESEEAKRGDDSRDPRTRPNRHTGTP